MSSHASSTTLSRRQMLRGFAAVAGSAFAGGSLLSGCSSSAYKVLPPPATAAVPVSSMPASIAQVRGVLQPVPAGAVAAAALTVTGATAGNYAEGFAGLAYEKQALCGPLFSASNSSLVKLFKLLGPGVLCAGGTSVDQCVWTPGGAGKTAGQIAPADVDALASFLQAAGWSCIYGVNLGGSASGATTPQMAAAEVSYVARKLGSLLAGVELGNECESYGDPGSYYPGAWTVESFESLWKQYRDAIIAVTPDAPIAGPAAAADVDRWTIPFGEYVTGERIGTLTQHYARAAATASTVDDLVTADTALASELLQLRYGAQSMDVPFRMTRLSCCSDGGVAGVSDAYASSLWAIDAIFQCAAGGAGGVNLASGGQALDAAIADDGGMVDGPRPVFFGMLLAAMAGRGDLLSTQIDAGSQNVTAYALRCADGSVSVVVVNKDAAQSLKMAVTLPESMSTATLLSLTQASAGASGPSLAALAGVTVQGAAVAPDGSFTPGTPYALEVDGAQLSCYVPALSAVLVRVS